MSFETFMYTFPLKMDDPSNKKVQGSLVTFSFCRSFCSLFLLLTYESLSTVCFRISLHFPFTFGLVY